MDIGAHYSTTGGVFGSAFSRAFCLLHLSPRIPRARLGVDGKQSVTTLLKLFDALVANSPTATTV